MRRLIVVVKAVCARAVCCLFCIFVFVLKIDAINDKTQEIIIKKNLNSIKENAAAVASVFYRKAGIYAMPAFFNGIELIQRRRYIFIPSIWFALSTEYLQKLSPALKAGIDISYLLPIQSGILNKRRNNISYFSPSLVLLAHPKSSAQNLYFKTLLGFSIVSFKSQMSRQTLSDIYFSPVWGLSFNFPLCHSGWQIEIFHNVYFSKLEYDEDERFAIQSFERTGIRIYKKLP